MSQSTTQPVHVSSQGLVVLMGGPLVYHRVVVLRAGPLVYHRVVLMGGPLVYQGARCAYGGPLVCLLPSPIAMVVVCGACYLSPVRSRYQRSSRSTKMPSSRLKGSATSAGSSSWVTQIGWTWMLRDQSRGRLCKTDSCSWIATKDR